MGFTALKEQTKFERTSALETRDRCQNGYWSCNHIMRFCLSMSSKLRARNNTKAEYEMQSRSANAFSPNPEYP